MRRLCCIICMLVATLSLVASNIIPHHHHNGIVVFSYCEENHENEDCDNHNNCCNSNNEDECKTCPLSITKLSILKTNQNELNDNIFYVSVFFDCNEYNNIESSAKRIKYFSFNDTYTSSFVFSSLALRAPPAI